MSYPGTADVSSTQPGSNSVIFGHSSFFKDRPGRYKSIFTSLPEADPGEEIWIYQKETYTNGTSEFILRRYVVEDSYETTADNVNVLLPKEGTQDTYLTAITCTPIGWNKDRWIVNAKLIATEDEATYRNLTQQSNQERFQAQQSLYASANNQYANSSLLQEDEQTVFNSAPNENNTGSTNDTTNNNSCGADYRQCQSISDLRASSASVTFQNFAENAVCE